MAEISRQLGICTSAIAEAIRKKEGEDYRKAYLKRSPGGLSISAPSAGCFVPLSMERVCSPGIPAGSAVQE